MINEEETKKESIKLRILKIFKLTTISYMKNVLAYKTEKHNKDIGHLTNQYAEIQLKDKEDHKTELKKQQTESKEKIKELEDEYEEEIKKLKMLHKKDITKLKEKIDKQKEELDNMHKKYDGKYILEKLAPDRTKSKLVTRISNRNGVRSRIARNSVRDLEKVEEN